MSDKTDGIHCSVPIYELPQLIFQLLRAMPGIESAGLPSDRPVWVEMAVLPLRRRHARLLADLFRVAGHDCRVRAEPRDHDHPAAGDSGSFVVRARLALTASRALACLAALMARLEPPMAGLRPASRTLPANAWHKLSQDVCWQGPGGDGRVGLSGQRLNAVKAILGLLGSRRVIDLGCGTGVLLSSLSQYENFTMLAGVDISTRAIDAARRRLRLRWLPVAQRRRIRLHQATILRADHRLLGYDTAVLSEVVEHIPPPCLAELEDVVFCFMRPRFAVVTTPNFEQTWRYPTLFSDGLRHPDHHFEWTRHEFACWASRICARHGYQSRILHVGLDDPVVGAPTQIAVFDARPSSRALNA